MANCDTSAKGTNCITGLTSSNCTPWNITEQSKTNCLANAYQQESLNIAGAKVNVFKLLGIHEQTLLLDLTGNGNAISGGDAVKCPALNAFNKLTTSWRSIQSGANIINSAYIGYDFGFIKISTGRQRYGVDTSVRHQITTIKIKQGKQSANRVTKARVERSEDGINWYGVSVIDLPDDDNLNIISFKHSVPNRYWRLRPIIFNGNECDAWIVQALELHDYSQTELTNIQDKILLENRDRDYQSDATELRGFYDPQSPNTDLSRFGLELPSLNYQIKINFDQCISMLGRPIVIGDIIELPSEIQYTPDLIPIKKYLEVTDVTWDSTTYTPGWEPTMLLITAMPAIASQETQDIFGDLSKHIDSSGLFDNDDGNEIIWQDYSDVDQTIKEEALNQLPERGSDAKNVIRQFEQSELDMAKDVGIKSLNKIGLNPTELYVESAIPPNNAPFTEGPTFPDNPSGNDYHRLTYEGLSKDVPARLYRWSTTKNRWIYLETDKRQQFNNQKEILEEYLASPTRTPSNNIY